MRVKSTFWRLSITSITPSITPETPMNKGKVIDVIDVIDVFQPQVPVKSSFLSSLPVFQGESHKDRGILIRKIKLYSSVCRNAASFVMRRALSSNEAR